MACHCEESEVRKLFGLAQSAGRTSAALAGGTLVLCLISRLVAAPPDGIDPPSKLERFEFEQVRMGVPFRISLYSRDKAVANDAARAAFARIKELNLILSDYEPDSELMRLCRTSRPGRPVQVSPELFFVLQRALAVSKASEGAFDVTVGPLVALWREARRSRTMPEPEKVAAARERVGWKFMRLDPTGRAVELLKPGMRLDLGGIAKGYAGDEALRVLEQHGVARALVAAAGDIVAGDPPPDRPGWRIGIAPLDAPEGPPSRHVLLENAAVSTSGDAFQYVEIDGVRYSHIVDPQTGLGLTTRSSATVVASDGISADSLASAVSVLGPERGLKLIATREATAALIVESDEGKTRTWESPTLKGHLE